MKKDTTEGRIKSLRFQYGYKFGTDALYFDQAKNSYVYGKLSIPEFKVIYYNDTAPKCDEVLTALRMMKFVEDPRAFEMLALNCDVCDDDSYRKWKVSWKKSYKNLSDTIRFLKKLRKTKYLADVRNILEDKKFSERYNFIYYENTFTLLTQKAASLATKLLLIKRTMKFARKQAEWERLYNEEFDHVKAA